MLNRLLILVLLVQSLPVFSQSLILSGKAVSLLGTKIDKLYFSANPRSFNKNHFVNVKADRSYTFNLPLAVLKKDGLKEMYFSARPTADQSDDNACTWKILVGYLSETTLYKDSASKDIHVKTDIFYDLSCAARLYEGAQGEKETRFLGAYKMKSGDTSYLVMVNADFFQVTAQASGVWPLYLPTETGEWKFDESKHTFTIHITAAEATYAGLRVQEDKYYSFTVQEENGKLVFTNPSASKAVLEKVD